MKRDGVLIIPRRLHPFKCGRIQEAILRAIREYKERFPWRSKVPLSYVLRELPGIPEDNVLDALKRLEARGFVKFLKR